MAGVLSFKITADAAGLVAATTTGQTAVNSFSSSVQNIGTMIRRNAPSLHVSGDSMKLLGTATRSTTASLQALQGAFTLFGGQVASQLVGGIYVGKNALDAMRASAEATKLSFATMSGIFAVVGASLYSLSRAFTEFNKARDAQAKEVASEKRLNESIEDRRKRLFGMLDLAEGEGLIPEIDAEWLRTSFKIARDPAAQNTALGNIGQRLDSVGMAPVNDGWRAAQEKYEAFLRTFQARAEGQDAERVEAIYQATAAALKEAFELSQSSGQSFERIRQVIMAARDKELKELEKTEEAANELDSSSETTSTRRGIPQVSNWEKIGFVFRGGVTGESTGERKTVDAVNQSNKLLQKILRAVEKPQAPVNLSRLP